MHLVATHKVPELEKPIRLQEYAVGIFTTAPTKSALKKAIKKELVFVDDRIATTAKFIIGGEKITLFKKENSNSYKRLIFPLEVVFEDDYLAIVYKPAGILVSGNKFKTVDNALSQNLKKSTKTDAVRPRPVHRLDYATAGLLLIGKTTCAITTLGKLFENKEIQKTYHAITIGKMEQNGTIDLPIDKKESITDFQLIKSVESERFHFLNLVKLASKTGRRHQIRKHLAAIGNPILGDLQYSPEKLLLKGKGMYLHASSLEFIHPFTTEKVTITKNIPKKYSKIFPL